METRGNEAQGGAKRHFSMPQDWLNTECLDLAVMIKEGPNLCTRNDEIGIVADGLKNEWIR